MNTRFVLGQVGAAFGLNGFVKIKSFSGETAHFSHLKNVTLKKEEKEETREIAEISYQGNTLLIRFEGINNPEKAGTLKGAELIAGREFASPLEEGEFYIEDLKGLLVTGTDGKNFGRLMDIIEGGNGFLAEVLLDSGEKRFVPYRKEFFGEPNLKEGKIELLEPWILEES